MWGDERRLASGRGERVGRVVEMARQMWWWREVVDANGVDACLQAHRRSMMRTWGLTGWTVDVVFGKNRE